MRVQTELRKSGAGGGVRPPALHKAATSIPYHLAPYCGQAVV